ncbi:MAG: hypothetical protein JO040_11120 [Gemmatimonadetes bacterium]|nr:hypothetical protein [Gemmatimonadota bacterium]
MRFGRMRRLGGAMLAASLLSACYTQTPVGTGAEPAPNAHVVVQLTDSGAAEMTRWLGPGVASVEGDVGAVRADTLELLVSSTQQRNGELSLWKGEPVSFPRSALASVYERRLSRSRSYALVGAFVAGAVIVGRIFGLGTTSDPPGGGGTVPQQ